MHVFSYLGQFHDSCIFDTMSLENKKLEKGFGSWHTKCWFHSLNKLGNWMDFNNRQKNSQVNTQIFAILSVHIILRHTSSPQACTSMGGVHAVEVYHKKGVYKFGHFPQKWFLSNDDVLHLLLCMFRVAVDIEKHAKTVLAIWAPSC